MTDTTTRVGQWADHVSGGLDPRRVTRDDGDYIWIEGPSGAELGPYPALNYSFTDTNVQATNLRAIADWLDAHPDTPPTHIEWEDRAAVRWLLFYDDDQLAKATRIRRSIGGTWDKQSLGDLLKLRRAEADGGVDCEITVSRAGVCTRPVVGTETVTIPAVEAQPERVETRTVYGDWECSPLLAADGAE